LTFPVLLGMWVVSVAPQLPQSGVATVPHSVSGSPAVPAASPGDSVRLHGQAKGAQARFERLRVASAPMTWRTYTGPCDERLGRLCLTFGPENIEVDSAQVWTPPEEVPAVVEGREELLSVLEDVAERIPADSWVLGQRIAYLGEAGRWEEALTLVRSCPMPSTESWWCLALEGMVLHRMEDWVPSLAAFDRALSKMSGELAETWVDPGVLLEHEGRQLLVDAPPDSLSRLRDAVWTLADPLYLVPGNDRFTEHLSRHVLALIREDSRNPYQMRWGDDLSEFLVRYGPEVAFEQERAPPLHLGPPPVVGRLNPESRGVMPRPDDIADVTAIPIGDWTLDRRRVRERHEPTYAARIELMEVQQARFLRGDDLLVVVGWIPQGEQTGDSDSPEGHDGPGTELESSLFLVDGATLEPVSANVRMRPGPVSDRGRGRVSTARVPTGSYLLSLEALDTEAGRAWRARHGVAARAVPRGVVALSDLLLLAPGSETRSAFGSTSPASSIEAHGPPGDRASSGPEEMATLEENLHRVLPGVRLADRVVEVAWEVYGMEGLTVPLVYRLAVEPVERGVLRAAAEFLRIVEPRGSLDLVWAEGGGGFDEGSLEPSLRSIVVDLSALPPGEMRLALTLELPGREPVTAERMLELPE
jgi:hypothetical protein